MFPVTSRYFGIETAEFTSADGKKHPYLRRRFLPSTDGTVLAEHTVTQAERLDNITARYLDDPEQFWRLCDANGALHPRELTAEIGRRLLVPMPGGDGP
jgi:hypothetical protein